ATMTGVQTCALPNCKIAVPRRRELHHVQNRDPGVEALSHRGDMGRRGSRAFGEIHREQNLSQLKHRSSLSLVWLHIGFHASLTVSVENAGFDPWGAARMRYLAHCMGHQAQPWPGARR